VCVPLQPKVHAQSSAGVRRLFLHAMVCVQQANKCSGAISVGHCEWMEQVSPPSGLVTDGSQRAQQSDCLTHTAQWSCLCAIVLQCPCVLCVLHAVGVWTSCRGYPCRRQAPLCGWRCSRCRPMGNRMECSPSGAGNVHQAWPASGVPWATNSPGEGLCCESVSGLGTFIKGRHLRAAGYLLVGTLHHC
jgi:hypothetical protein